MPRNLTWGVGLFRVSGCPGLGWFCWFVVGLFLVLCGCVV